MYDVYNFIRRVAHCERLEMIKFKVGFLTNVNFMGEQVVVTPIKYQITRDGNEITLDVYIPSKNANLTVQGSFKHVEKAFGDEFSMEL